MNSSEGCVGKGVEAIPKYTGGICSVTSNYSTEALGKVRYGLNTLPNTPVRSGTDSTRVPDTSVR